MFRLQQSQPDPAEEQKRVAAEVRFNFILFGAVIAAVRLGTWNSYVKSLKSLIYSICLSCVNSTHSPEAFKYGVEERMIEED